MKGLDMNRLCALIVTLGFVFASVGFSCGQNGPTKPSVSLSWTQSTATGVTGNCVYRGATAFTPTTGTTPAIFCSPTPITSYVDTTVSPGTVYHYAVTAQVGTTESQFSNDGLASVPALPPSPNLNTPGPVTGKLEKPAGKDAPQLSAKVVWTK